jgi:NAD(P)-dependent dehydrogenase (short-subunit alcohol dehydrogenase family)
MLDDRIALITGASRGIGAATAQLLARHGAAVAANYAANDAAARRAVADIAAGQAVRSWSAATVPAPRSWLSAGRASAGSRS